MVAGFKLLSISAGFQTTKEPQYISFSQGKQFYSGNKFVSISNQGTGDWNQYKGTTFKSGLIMVGGKTPSIPTGESSVTNSSTSSTNSSTSSSGDWEEFRGLIRFDDLYVPPGSIVLAAVVEVALACWQPNFVLAGSYLSSTWNESSPDISWRYRETDVEWEKPGILGGKNDVVSDTFNGQKLDFEIPLAGKGMETVQFVLNGYMVQKWVQSTELSQGRTPGLVLWKKQGPYGSIVNIYSRK
jgi:hypothetical protein